MLQREEVRYGYINGTVDLVCQVHAEPPPTFKWSKKNSPNGRMKDFKGKIENYSDEVHRSVAKVKILLFERNVSFFESLFQLPSS